MTLLPAARRLQMDYPTANRIAVATRAQTCEWLRLLPTPATDDEARLLKFIRYRLGQVGEPDSEGNNDADHR